MPNVRPLEQQRLARISQRGRAQASNDRVRRRFVRPREIATHVAVQTRVSRRRSEPSDRGDVFCGRRTADVCGALSSVGLPDRIRPMPRDPAELQHEPQPGSDAGGEAAVEGAPFQVDVYCLLDRWQPGSLGVHPRGFELRAVRIESQNAHSRSRGMSGIDDPAGPDIDVAAAARLEGVLRVCLDLFAAGDRKTDEGERGGGRLSAMRVPAAAHPGAIDRRMAGLLRMFTRTLEGAADQLQGQPRTGRTRREYSCRSYAIVRGTGGSRGYRIWIHRSVRRFPAARRRRLFVVEIA